MLSSDPAPETELWTALRATSDEDARQHLFARHAGFARAIARRLFLSRERGDLEFEDLHQWGLTGLLEAIDRFEPDRGVTFRAFAAHRISGSISNGIARYTDVRSQQSAQARWKRERLRSLVPDKVDGLSSQDAMQALIEIAMGFAVGFMLEGTTLYQDEDEGDVATPAGHGYESAAWAQLTRRLLTEVEALPPREAMILKQHYLHEASFDTLAELMQVSKGRISQLHRAALITLRKRLARHGHFSLER